jgi:hypothetical protein
VEVESLWLLVALDCQCIFRQALLYLESNDAVESAELVVGDYLPQDNRAKHQEDTPSTTHARQESKKEDSTNSTIKNSGLEKQNQLTGSLLIKFLLSWNLIFGVGIYGRLLLLSITMRRD